MASIASCSTLTVCYRIRLHSSLSTSSCMVCTITCPWIGTSLSVCHWLRPNTCRLRLVMPPPMFAALSFPMTRLAYLLFPVNFANGIISGSFTFCMCPSTLQNRMLTMSRCPVRLHALCVSPPNSSSRLLLKPSKITSHEVATIHARDEEISLGSSLQKLRPGLRSDLYVA